MTTNAEVHYHTHTRLGIVDIESCLDCIYKHTITVASEGEAIGALSGIAKLLFERISKLEDQVEALESGGRDSDSY